MNKITRQKLEAIIRCDIENAPYKYRDARYVLLNGMPPYKDMSKEEIDEEFETMELKITKQDRDWAKYQEEEDKEAKDKPTRKLQ